MYIEISTPTTAMYNILKIDKQKSTRFNIMKRKLPSATSTTRDKTVHAKPASKGVRMVAEHDQLVVLAPLHRIRWFAVSYNLATTKIRTHLYSESPNWVNHRNEASTQASLHKNCSTA